MTKDLTEKELKKLVIDALNSPSAFTKCTDTKNKELFIILVNGKRVVMRSGKKVWNGKGPAKSALRNHINEPLHMNKIGQGKNSIKLPNGNTDYSTTRSIIREAEDEWMEKHVVIMPFSEWFALQKKLSNE